MSHIKSYLPVFSGFYETDFQADEEQMIEEGYTYDDYDWDYDAYHQRVCISCVGTVEAELNRLGFPIKIQYESLQSPRYYNFTNDSINVTYRLMGASLGKIKNYVKSNMEAFNAYIKSNYSSYDGFTSFHSNNGSQWLTYINGKSLEENTHYLGTFLDFILQNEDYTDNDLFRQAVEGNIYVQGTLKEETN